MLYLMQLSGPLALEYVACGQDGGAQNLIRAFQPFLGLHPLGSEVFVHYDHAFTWLRKPLVLKGLHFDLVFTSLRLKYVFAN
jgi:hypothetical protein